MSRVIGYIVLAGALIGAGAAYRQHVYSAGVTAENTRWLGIQARADKALEDKLAAANTRISGLQAALDHTSAALEQAGKETTNAKITSAALQSDLAAGRQRLSVLTRSAAGQAAAARTDQGAGAAPVDPGRAVRVDLDGRTAGDLEWLRQTRNDALAGLRGCIVSYDALKAAQDGAGSH